MVGVWVGNDDGRPMPGVTGGGLPALIFRDFILRAQGDERRSCPLPPPAKPHEAPLVDAIGDLRLRRGPLDQALVRLTAPAINPIKLDADGHIARSRWTVVLVAPVIAGSAPRRSHR